MKQHMFDTIENRRFIVCFYVSNKTTFSTYISIDWRKMYPSQICFKKTRILFKWSKNPLKIPTRVLSFIGQVHKVFRTNRKPYGTDPTSRIFTQKKITGSGFTEYWTEWPRCGSRWWPRRRGGRRWPGSAQAPSTTDLYNCHRLRP